MFAHFDFDRCTGTLLSHLCDGIRHCPQGDDEWFCDLTCPNECECAGLYVSCRNLNLTTLPAAMPKNVKKLDLSDNGLGPDLSTVDFSPHVELGELILQRNGIEVLSMQHNTHKNDRICICMCVNIIIVATAYKKYLISRSFNEYAREVRWKCCLYMNIHEHERITHVLAIMLL